MQNTGLIGCRVREERGLKVEDVPVRSSELEKLGQASVLCREIMLMQKMENGCL